jgi:hypothetical protein
VPAVDAPAALHHEPANSFLSNRVQGSQKPLGEIP